MERKKVLLLYRDNKKGKLVNCDNEHQTSKRLCDGFEIVYAANLRKLFPGMNLCFVCCDDFNRLSNPYVNYLGTILYGTGYPIQGNICILSISKDMDGEYLAGMSLEEARYIKEILDNII